MVNWLRMTLLRCLLCAAMGFVIGTMFWFVAGYDSGDPFEPWWEQPLALGKGGILAGLVVGVLWSVWIVLPDD